MPRLAVSARARARILEEMRALSVTQQDLADRMTRRDDVAWHQSTVGKVLTGAVRLQVDVAALMAECLGLHLSEVIRDRGLEFYAELTPTEVRILERLRQRPQLLQGLLLLLDLQVTKPVSPPATKRKVGRPLNSDRDRISYG